MRIIIADDHAIVRKGLKQILLEAYPSAIIEEVSDAGELVKKTMLENWDVIICDLSMPGRSGLEALKQIKHSFPKLPVLIMSMYPEDQYAVRVLKAGASGYLSKSSIHDELVKAIEAVLRGKKFITPAIAEQLLDTFQTEGDKDPYHLLSDREFDVFKLLASGKTNFEIAEQLSISTTTVSTYRSRILEKLNLRSNTELTRYAIERNLI
jgi:two-component system, NarL family, invasion response regulator UvrY